MPHFTSIRRLATSSLVGYAEEGIITFTNVLQGHDTVVLVWYTSEYCSWKERDTSVINVVLDICDILLILLTPFSDFTRMMSLGVFRWA